MIDKIITICEKICSGNCHIERLFIDKYCFEIIINDIDISFNEKGIIINTNKGVLRKNNLTDLEIAQLKIAFINLYNYSQKFANDFLDDFINGLDIKKTNIDDLD